MGARRKPTAQLLRTTELRACRHGDRSLEPRPSGAPVMPAGLPRDAQQHWAEIVPALVELGVATALDTPALVRLCQFWSEVESARRTRKKDRARLLRMVTAHREWANLAARFGLTPTDRARVVSTSQQQQRSATASHIA